MPEPKRELLAYEAPQGKPGPGAYIAMSAAVALAMLIALVAFHVIDWRINLGAGPGGGGGVEFPRWFQVVASGAIGVVATASVGGLVAVLVALCATARRAFRRGL